MEEGRSRREKQEKRYFKETSKKGNPREKDTESGLTKENEEFVRAFCSDKAFSSYSPFFVELRMHLPTRYNFLALKTFVDLLYKEKTGEKTLAKIYPSQFEELRKEYKRDPRAGKEEKIKLAQRLGIPEKRVLTWWYGQSLRDKQEIKKMENREENVERNKRRKVKALAAKRHQQCSSSESPHNESNDEDKDGTPTVYPSGRPRRTHVSSVAYSASPVRIETLPSYDIADEETEESDDDYVPASLKIKTQKRRIIKAFHYDASLQPPVKKRFIDDGASEMAPNVYVTCTIVKRVRPRKRNNSAPLEVVYEEDNGEKKKDNSNSRPRFGIQPLPPTVKNWFVRKEAETQDGTEGTTPNCLAFTDRMKEVEFPSSVPESVSGRIENDPAKAQEARVSPLKQTSTRRNYKSADRMREEEERHGLEEVPTEPVEPLDVKLEPDLHEPYMYSVKEVEEIKQEVKEEPEDGRFPREAYPLNKMFPDLVPPPQPEIEEEVDEDLEDLEWNHLHYFQWNTERTKQFLTIDMRVDSKRMENVITAAQQLKMEIDGEMLRRLMDEFQKINRGEPDAENLYKKLKLTKEIITKIRKFLMAHENNICAV